MKQETGTIHIDTYFTCLEHMKRKFERDGRQYPVKTDSRESYLQWKAGDPAETLGTAGTL